MFGRFCQGNQTSQGERAVEWVIECGREGELEREARMEAAGDADEELIQLVSRFRDSIQTQNSRFRFEFKLNMSSLDELMYWSFHVEVF
jgi:hypothetical protein